MQKSAFHRAQTLSYKNGYALPIRPKVGIGDQPLSSENLQNEMNQLAIDALITSPDTSTHTPPSNFIPAHVVYEKKVMNCLFQQVHRNLMHQLSQRP